MFFNLNLFSSTKQSFTYKLKKIHYENTPMQYAAIFKGCKNGYFQIKNCDIFLIFAQNIDYGYTLELPQ